MLSPRPIGGWLEGEEVCRPGRLAGLLGRGLPVGRPEGDVQLSTNNNEHKYEQLPC